MCTPLIEAGAGIDVKTANGATALSEAAGAGTAQHRRSGGFKLKTPWRDGSTHLVMRLLEFMPRLAALVPCPPVLPCGLEWESRLRDCFTAKSPGT